MAEIGQEITIVTPGKKIFTMIVEKMIPQDEGINTYIGTHPIGGNRMSVTGFQVVKK